MSKNKTKINNKMSTILKVLIPSSFLIFICGTTIGFATAPDRAVVKHLRGERKLLLRQGGRTRLPIQVGTELRKYKDDLVVNPNTDTHAVIEFFSSSDREASMYAKTNPHHESSIYYFPCRFRGGSLIFGWRRLKNGAERVCELAVRLQRGNFNAEIYQPKYNAVAEIFRETLITQSLFAQSAARQISFCSVQSASGDSFLNIRTEADSCQKALEKCQQSTDGDQCTIANTDRWWNNEPKLSAYIECADGQLFTVEGDGSNMKDLAQKQWNQVQSQGLNSCFMGVLASGDKIVFPAADEIVLATGDEEIMVQSNNTKIDVLKGAINIRSVRKTEPTLVQKGERYNLKTDRVENFNQERAFRSVNVEVLTAELEELPFCDEQQVSGGQEGGKRIVQLTTNKGEIQVQYEMYEIPDRLQLIYEGQTILDTGFVDGGKTLSIPFQGISGRIEVKLTGNLDDPETEWDYTLSCPT